MLDSISKQECFNSGDVDVWPYSERYAKKSIPERKRRFEIWLSSTASVGMLVAFQEMLVCSLTLNAMPIRSFLREWDVWKLDSISNQITVQEMLVCSLILYISCHCVHTGDMSMFGILEELVFDY